MHFSQVCRARGPWKCQGRLVRSYGLSRIPSLAKYDNAARLNTQHNELKPLLRHALSH